MIAVCPAHAVLIRTSSLTIEIPVPTLTASVLEVFVSPSPAVICPAPENCENSTAVEPKVIAVS